MPSNVSLRPAPRAGGGSGAGAMQAAVTLEPGVQAALGQSLRRFEVVEHHANRDALRGDALHVRDVREIERKCPCDVGEPAAGKRLGLEERGDRDALRAVRELATSELETFVRLDVRPQREPA